MSYVLQPPQMPPLTQTSPIFAGRSSLAVAFAATALIAFSLLPQFSKHLFAQDETAPALLPAPSVQSQPHTLRLEDFEDLALAAVRHEFPRLPGFSAMSHSCRLPEYGPLISISVQPPTYYFTRPILLELERRQRIAEQQARRMRMEIDRAAQIISLKAREAVLSEQLEAERGHKKKSVKIDEIEKDLSDVRKSINALDGPMVIEEQTVISVGEPMKETDLNKLMMNNYRQLMDRLGNAMKNTLAENGALIDGLGPNERVCITAHIRESFMGNREKSMIFVLNPADIQAFRKGSLTLPALKGRIVSHVEEKQ